MSFICTFKAKSVVVLFRKSDESNHYLKAHFELTSRTPPHPALLAPPIVILCLIPLKMVVHIFTAGKSEQFKKYNHGTVDTLKVKYDYLSIMHYGKDYFAKLDQDKRHYLMTIKTKDPSYQDRIGQRGYLTESDKLMMNTMYGCPGNKCHILTAHVLW